MRPTRTQLTQLTQCSVLEASAPGAQVQAAAYHDIMPLHLRLFRRQLVTLQLQAVTSSHSSLFVHGKTTTGTTKHPQHVTRFRVLKKELDIKIKACEGKQMTFTPTICLGSRHSYYITPKYQEKILRFVVL